jgi:hypothetical protein
MAVIDSAHLYDHEIKELELVRRNAVPGAVVVSDNPGSHAFADFCREHDLVWQEFWERPRAHIHPGAGLALAQL